MSDLKNEIEHDVRFDGAGDLENEVSHVGKLDDADNERLGVHAQSLTVRDLTGD
jgi:hypothetical protein